MEIRFEIHPRNFLSCVFSYDRISQILFCTWSLARDLEKSFSGPGAEWPFCLRTATTR